MGFFGGGKCDNKYTKKYINYKIIKIFVSTLLTYLLTHIFYYLFIHIYTLRFCTVGFYIINYGSWNLLMIYLLGAFTCLLTLSCCEETLLLRVKSVCKSPINHKNLGKRIMSKFRLSSANL
jgi:magnesium-transporting ATPase (P-type)